MNINFKWWGNSRNAAPKSNKKADINQYINKNHSNRIKQDIGKWREAIEEMENSYYKHRVKVQGIYKDTVLNGHVRACINKRKNITLLQEFAFVDKNGNPIDNITNDIFKKKWFADTLNYILDGQLYGYSLVNWTELQNGLPANVQIINREFINPDACIVGTFPYATSGLELNDKSIYSWSLYSKTNSEHGISQCGYGLLYEVAFYEILLRNLMGYNADFVEKFGQPVIMVDTMKTDEDERGYLEDMISTLGSSGYMIKDAQDVVTYLEYSKADKGYEAYANLEKRCEEKISKVLLGHADALDSTPGKLGTQGELSPSQIALNEIQTIDSNYLEYYVNDYLIPKLKSLGIMIPDGRFIFLNNTEKELQEEKEIKTTTAIAQYVKTLSEAGVSVDIQWLSTKLDIPLNSLTPEVAPITPNTGKIENDVKNPYLNQHAFRILEPTKFVKTSYKRKNIAPGIDIIIANLIGENTLTTQAYRFNKDKYTFAQAKKWMKEHKIDYLTAEKASA